MSRPNRFSIDIPMMYWVEFEKLCIESKLEPDKMATAITVQFVKNWLEAGCPDVFKEVRNNGSKPMEINKG